MKEYLQLFSSFCRIGAFTFGGGYAMLPMLQREVVKKYGWATEEELLNYFTIGQCTPGIIAVNTAVFVGYKRKGFGGAIAAAAGAAFPSFVIIIILAAFFQNFAHVPAVKHAFAGVRAAVAVLIVTVVARLQKTALTSLSAFLIFGAVVVLGLSFKVSPIPMVAAAALIGWLLYRRDV